MLINRPSVGIIKADIMSKKDGSERKKEIVEIAKSLFEQDGYENTSVEKIIKSADIAKGTFYYYFNSKSDILKAVVDAMAEEMIVLIKNIIDDNKIEVINKLKTIFTGSSKKKIISSTVMEAIHRAENRELQERLNIQYIDKIVPHITEVFNQGYKEGLWGNKVSVYSMQVVLAGTQFILDSGLFALSDKERKDYLSEVVNLVELLIQAKVGTLSVLIK